MASPRTPMGQQCVFLPDGEQKLFLDRVKHQNGSLEVIGDDGALSRYRWIGCDLLMCITELDISPIRTDKSSTHGIEFGLDCVFGPSGPDGVGGSVVSVILDVVLDGASKSFQVHGSVRTLRHGRTSERPRG